MADEEIEVADDDIVTIELDDAPSLVPEPQVKVADAPKRERERKTDAAAEASAALNQAVKTAESEAASRKAAEATAQAERRAREDADRRANQLAQESKDYKEQAESRELTILTTGIENAQREMETHEAEIGRLMEAGEFIKVGAVQGKLAKAAAALDRLEDAKSSFEAGARKPTEGRVTPPVALPAGEQYLSGFDPQAQTWLRAHPECLPAHVGGNAQANAKMMQGHYNALEKGLTPNTPQYFANIEEFTGHREPVTSAAATVTAAAAAEEPRPAPKQQQRQPQPSAPVSRDPPTPAGQQTQRTVRLSKEQQEIALISYAQKPGETDDAYKKRAYGSYATEFLKAQAEGRIGRMTH